MVKLVVKKVSLPCWAPRLVPVKLRVQAPVEKVVQVSLSEKLPTMRNGANPVTVNVTSWLKFPEKWLPSGAAEIPVAETEPLIVSPWTSEHALKVIVAEVPSALMSAVTEPLTAHGVVRAAAPTTFCEAESCVFESRATARSARVTARGCGAAVVSNPVAVPSAPPPPTAGLSAVALTCSALLAVTPTGVLGGGVNPAGPPPPPPPPPPPQKKSRAPRRAPPICSRPFFRLEFGEHGTSLWRTCIGPGRRRPLLQPR